MWEELQFIWKDVFTPKTILLTNQQIITLSTPLALHFYTFLISNNFQIAQRFSEIPIKQVLQIDAVFQCLHAVLLVGCLKPRETI